MAASGRPAPYDGIWTGRARRSDEQLRRNKEWLAPASASVVSSVVSFPLDSLKSRLQTLRERVSMPRLAAQIIREEGLRGLYRGLPLPLLTITINRTVSINVLDSIKRILISEPSADSLHGNPTANSPWIKARFGFFSRDSAQDIAATSLIAGATSGVVQCVLGAPFELVKTRRQLEFDIYKASHPGISATSSTQAHTSVRHPRNHSLPRSAIGMSATAPISHPNPGPALPKAHPVFVPPTTRQAVREIVNKAGYRGLYTGWRLQLPRDIMGSALYFAVYDVFRYQLGFRYSTSGVNSGFSDGLVQGDVPEWARGWLPKGVIPFVSGSAAGIMSWVVIYPIDTLRIKAQMRALSNQEPLTPWVQLMRLVRGTKEANPKPLSMGIFRLYQGLGVSSARTMLTHGAWWTIYDWVKAWIESQPFERAAFTIEAK
ncbi:mitochondrial carrier domain-containing protein [Naematelia encephala]|uniref:Mitochondrial carrier domain-containing protein n=1 Tax=Naematelia encephala TaxID=71784 RepID=A0A1Y2AHC1_9TREE|nr:mitochondrial carrier domain-containing protein [Naematelia encephala]